MGVIVKPSSDLRNHYAEISKLCREERTPVIITVNGRGDTAVLGLEEFNRMQAEIELYRNLAEAEEDVRLGHIGSTNALLASLRAELEAKSK